MIGQKLTNILQSLNTDEFRRLKKALSSPYFATNARFLSFYEYLKKYYPTFDEKKLKKEKLFKKLYPDRPFNDGLLRVMVREFTVVVEDFIMLERLRSDKQQRKKMLVKEYGQRNLYDYFKKGTTELLKSIEKKAIKGMENYSAQIELYQDYVFHNKTNDYDTKDDSLDLLMESVDAYFILAKYRLGHVLRNRKTVFKKDFIFRFSEVISNEKELAFIEQNKIVFLYRELETLVVNRDFEHFKEIKSELLNILSEMEYKDRNIIYTILLNFCIRQLNSDSHSYYPELFEMYKIGLKKDILINDGDIGDATFYNITKTGCEVQEFEWVEDFIENYQKYLKEDGCEETLALSTGLLHLEKKEFDKAISIYSTFNFSRKTDLLVRKKLIESIFEKSLLDKNYIFIFKSNIESFRKYLQRNDLFAPDRIESNNNYLRLMDGLSKRSWDNLSKEKIGEWVRKFIEKNPNTAMKSWFSKRFYIESLKYD